VVGNERSQNDVLFCPTDVWHRSYEAVKSITNLFGYQYLPGKPRPGEPGADASWDYASAGIGEWHYRKKLGGTYRVAAIMADKIQTDNGAWVSDLDGRSVPNSNHRGKGNVPTGGNFLFEDGRVAWRKFSYPNGRYKNTIDLGSYSVKWNCYYRPADIPKP
jgi:hypothetical protein